MGVDMRDVRVETMSNSSDVHVVHIPTQFQVTVTGHLSQRKNLEHAMRALENGVRAKETFEAKREIT